MEAADFATLRKVGEGAFGTVFRAADKATGAHVALKKVRIRDVRMDFRYGTAFGSETADAYERLLLDSILGDGTLFARDDEVAEAWRIVDSIIAGWKQSDRPPATYTAGTWGPAEADALLRRGRTWRRP